MEFGGQESPVQLNGECLMLALKSTTSVFTYCAFVESDLFVHSKGEVSPTASGKHDSGHDTFLV